MGGQVGGWASGRASGQVGGKGGMVEVGLLCVSVITGFVFHRPLLVGGLPDHSASTREKVAIACVSAVPLLPVLSQAAS